MTDEAESGGKLRKYKGHPGWKISREKNGFCMKNGRFFCPKGLQPDKTCAIIDSKFFLKAEDIRFDIRNLFRKLFLCNANG